VDVQGAELMSPGLFQRLIDLFSGKPFGSGAQISANEIPIYVKCGRCGQKVLLRLRKTSEIQRNFDRENHPNCEFYVKKVVSDSNSRCPNRMQIEIEFDDRYRVVKKQITSGVGEFITAKEYEESADKPAAN